jgi:hypothetical protein
MVSNELRAAAGAFREAMASVSAARDRLAEAVAAEADMPNAHARDRETRDALFQLKARLRGGELPEILGAAKMVSNIEGEVR